MAVTDNWYLTERGKAKHICHFADELAQGLIVKAEEMEDDFELPDTPAYRNFNYHI